MVTTRTLAARELRRFASQPVFEIYTHDESGARLETNPWFYVDGRQVFGLNRVMPPGTGKSVAHVHTDVEQRNIVYGGAATYRVGQPLGEEQVLGPGEELVIPPGTPHVDPYNASEGPLRLGTYFSPGSLPLFVYGRTLGQALRDGRLNDQQEFKLLHLMVLLAQPGNATFAAGPPIGVQRRVVIPMVAAIGRLRGYQPAFGFGTRKLEGPRYYPKPAGDVAK